MWLFAQDKCFDIALELQFSETHTLFLSNCTKNGAERDSENRFGGSGHYYSSCCSELSERQRENHVDVDAPDVDMSPVRTEKTVQSIRVCPIE
jgi:hypothetical protein